MEVLDKMRGDVVAAAKSLDEAVAGAPSKRGDVTVLYEAVPSLKKLDPKAVDSVLESLSIVRGKSYATIAQMVDADDSVLMKINEAVARMLDEKIMEDEDAKALSALKADESTEEYE